MLFCKHHFFSFETVLDTAFAALLITSLSVLEDLEPDDLDEPLPLDVVVLTESVELEEFEVCVPTVCWVPVCVPVVCELLDPVCAVSEVVCCTLEVSWVLLCDPVVCVLLLPDCVPVCVPSLVVLFPIAAEIAVR